MIIEFLRANLDYLGELVEIGAELINFLIYFSLLKMPFYLDYFIFGQISAAQHFSISFFG